MKGKYKLINILRHGKKEDLPAQQPLLSTGEGGDGWNNAHNQVYQKMDDSVSNAGRPTTTDSYRRQNLHSPSPWTREARNEPHVKRRPAPKQSRRTQAEAHQVHKIREVWIQTPMEQRSVVSGNKESTQPKQLSQGVPHKMRENSSKGLIEQLPPSFEERQSNRFENHMSCPTSQIGQKPIEPDFALWPQVSRQGHPRQLPDSSQQKQPKVFFEPEESLPIEPSVYREIELKQLSDSSEKADIYESVKSISEMTNQSTRKQSIVVSKPEKSLPQKPNQIRDKLIEPPVSREHKQKQQSDLSEKKDSHKSVKSLSEMTNRMTHGSIEPNSVVQPPASGQRKLEVSHSKTDRVLTPIQENVAVEMALAECQAILADLEDFETIACSSQMHTSSSVLSNQSHSILKKSSTSETSPEGKKMIHDAEDCVSEKHVSFGEHLVSRRMLSHDEDSDAKQAKRTPYKLSGKEPLPGVEEVIHRLEAGEVPGSFPRVSSLRKERTLRIGSNDKVNPDCPTMEPDRGATDLRLVANVHKDRKGIPTSGELPIAGVEEVVRKMEEGEIACAFPKISSWRNKRTPSKESDEETDPEEQQNDRDFNANAVPDLFPAVNSIQKERSQTNEEAPRKEDLIQRMEAGEMTGDFPKVGSWRKERKIKALGIEEVIRIMEARRDSGGFPTVEDGRKDTKEQESLPSEEPKIRVEEMIQMMEAGEVPDSTSVSSSRKERKLKTNFSDEDLASVDAVILMCDSRSVHSTFDLSESGLNIPSVISEEDDSDDSDNSSDSNDENREVASKDPTLKQGNRGTKDTEREDPTEDSAGDDDGEDGIESGSENGSRGRGELEESEHDSESKGDGVDHSTEEPVNCDKKNIETGEDAPVEGGLAENAATIPEVKGGDGKNTSRGAAPKTASDFVKDESYIVQLSKKKLRLPQTVTVSSYRRPAKRKNFVPRAKKITIVTDDDGELQQLDRQGLWSKNSTEMKSDLSVDTGNDSWVQGRLENTHPIARIRRQMQHKTYDVDEYSVYYY